MLCVFSIKKVVSQVSMFTFIIRHKNLPALKVTISSIIKQNICDNEIIILNYNASDADLLQIKHELSLSSLSLKIVSGSDCWASDLNDSILMLTTPYCIICDEGTVWSPDYLKISLSQLLEVNKKYGEITAYVSRGVENYGYYSKNTFRTKDIIHIMPSLPEGIMSISNMIFENQFTLAQAILNSDFIKKIKFNAVLNTTAYWDYCTQLMFLGNIYATNQLHTFLYYDLKDNQPPWPQNYILRPIPENDKKILHNYIFRKSIEDKNSPYNRIATERGFGHVYHLVNTLADRVRYLETSNHSSHEALDVLSRQVSIQNEVIDDVKKLSHNLSYNAFLLKADKIFDKLWNIKRKIFSNGK